MPPLGKILGSTDDPRLLFMARCRCVAASAAKLHFDEQKPLPAPCNQIHLAGRAFPAPRLNAVKLYTQPADHNHFCQSAQLFCPPPPCRVRGGVRFVTSGQSAPLESCFAISSAILYTRFLAMPVADTTLAIASRRRWPSISARSMPASA